MSRPVKRTSGDRAAARRRTASDSTPGRPIDEVADHRGVVVDQAELERALGADRSPTSTSPRSAAATPRASSSAGVTSTLEPGARPATSAAASRRTPPRWPASPTGPTHTVDRDVGRPRWWRPGRRAGRRTTTVPAAVELEHDRALAPRRRRPRSLDEVDQHGVEQAVDLDHGHDPSPQPARPARGSPGRRRHRPPRRRAAAAASTRPAAAVARPAASLATVPRDRGPVSVVDDISWILRSSSPHPGWSSWPGRAASAKRRSAPRWPAPPPAPACSTLVVEVEGKSGLAGHVRPAGPRLRRGRAVRGGGPTGRPTCGPARSPPTTPCSSTSSDHGL